MDQQKGKTTSEGDRGAGEQTRDAYSRQKDSEAPLPEERNNLVRNNNLYQHKQAKTSDTKTEAASQHTQPQRQKDNDVPQKKGGTIIYQQKLTTISYTKPDTEARPQQQRGGDIPIRRNDPESTLSDEEKFGEMKEVIKEKLDKLLG